MEAYSITSPKWARDMLCQTRMRELAAIIDALLQHERDEREKEGVIITSSLRGLVYLFSMSTLLLYDARVAGTQ